MLDYRWVTIPTRHARDLARASRPDPPDAAGRGRRSRGSAPVDRRHQPGRHQSLRAWPPLGTPLILLVEHRAPADSVMRLRVFRLGRLARLSCGRCGRGWQPAAIIGEDSARRLLALANPRLGQAVFGARCFGPRRARLQEPSRRGGCSCSSRALLAMSGRAGSIDGLADPVRVESAASAAKHGHLHDPDVDRGPGPLPARGSPLTCSSTRGRRRSESGDRVLRRTLEYSVALGVVLDRLLAVPCGEPGHGRGECSSSSGLMVWSDKQTFRVVTRDIRRANRTSSQSSLHRNDGPRAGSGGDGSRLDRSCCCLPRGSSPRTSRHPVCGSAPFHDPTFIAAGRPVQWRGASSRASFPFVALVRVDPLVALRCE